MQELLPENRIRKIFLLSVLLKAFNAVVQLFFGLVLLVTGTSTELISLLLSHELVEDPHDFIASHLAHYLTLISSSTQFFAAWYLLIHGAIKLVLMIALIKDKIWAYPASIAVVIAFIVYQVVRYTHTHSIFLALLTIFDVFVLWLISHEYKLVLKERSLETRF